MAEVDYAYNEQAALQSNYDAVGGTAVGSGISYSALSPSTKYLLVARGRFGGNSTGAFGMWVTDEGNIFTTDPVNASSWSFHKQNATGNTDLTDYFYVRSFTTQSSLTTGTVDLWFESDAQYDTAYADQCSLLLLNLDDLGSENYSEAVDDTIADIASGGWVDKAALTGLTSGSEYLVLAYQRPGAYANPYVVETRLIDGASTVYGYFQRKSGYGYEPITHGFMTRLSGQTSIKTQVQATYGWNEGGSYIIAIDTSAFAEFDYAYQASGFSALSSTDAAILSNTSVPARTSGNHLFLGQWSYTSAGASSRISASVKTGASTYGSATEVLAGDISVWASSALDTTDSESATVMGVQAYSGGASNNLYLGAGRNASDSNPTPQYGFVAVLSFEFASTALPVTLRPDGDGTRSAVVTETGSTSNLYASIDDDPDTPTTTDWNSPGAQAGSMFYDVTATPGNFSNMTSLNVKVHTAAVGFTVDSAAVYAQMFKSDETTALTDEVAVGSSGSPGLADVAFTLNAAGLAASKADWDAARLKLRWTYTA